MGNGQSLECVKKFYYLGDMIAAGGGAGEASRTRVRSGWAKFKELAPSRGASLKVKGRVNTVQRVLVYVTITCRSEVIVTITDLQEITSELSKFVTFRPCPLLFCLTAS